MQWVIRYLLHPLDSIEAADEGSLPSLFTAFLMVVGGGISALVWVPSNEGLNPFGMGSYLIVHIIVWGFQSMILDFSAQLLGHSAPRLSLLTWLGVSQVFLWLLVPIRVLEGIPLLGHPWVIVGAIMAVIITYLTLNQLIVMRVYQVGAARSLLVLAMPWVLIALAGGILMATLVAPTLLATPA